MPYGPSYFEESFGRNGGRPYDRFVPVPEEETGFAVSLFVGAAHGTLATTGSGQVGPASLGECNRLLSVLSRVDREPGPAMHGAYRRTLEGAFRVLWKHYDGDDRQASVCARVLGFYLLMEETEGGLVEGWVNSCEENEELMVLHPAVVATLACVALTRDGVLHEAEFRTRLEAYAM